MPAAARAAATPVPVRLRRRSANANKTAPKLGESSDTDPLTKDKFVREIAQLRLRIRNHAVHGVRQGMYVCVNNVVHAGVAIPMDLQLCKQVHTTVRLPCFMVLRCSCLAPVARPGSTRSLQLTLCFVCSKPSYPSCSLCTRTSAKRCRGCSLPGARLRLGMACAGGGWRRPGRRTPRNATPAGVRSDSSGRRATRPSRTRCGAHWPRQHPRRRPALPPLHSGGQDARPRLSRHPWGTSPPHPLPPT